LHATIPLLAWAYADGDHHTAFALVRVALSVALLGIPAAAMGATFPIASTWIAARAGSAADAGMLYGANSAGAAAGAIGAGFWLIPAVGLRGTVFIGVALNMAAAAGALWLARHDTSVEAPPPPKRQTRAMHTDPAQPRLAGLAAAAAVLSGFLALVYEVAWTRLIALIIGPTTYAFAAMVASFISGIALGSLAGTRVARRTSQPGLWLAAMLATASTSAVIAAWFAASRLPLVLAHDVGAGAGFVSLLARELLYIAVLLLPTSIASGAAFPLALATARSETATVGRDVARIYAANTVGAVSGALAAGFAIIPRLGVQSTFEWMSRTGTAGAVLLAVTLLTAQTSTRRRGRMPVAAPVIAALLLTVAVETLPDWDHNLLASGPYKYARFIGVEGLEDSLRAGRLEYYKEGAAGTVSVRRLGGSLALAIDGKVDASNAGDMLTQRLLGLLPVVLHPNPHDLLVIGLGSGVTVASALASSEVVHADVLEISREVVDASSWFAHENAGVLQNPRVRLLVGDGRTHLLLSRRQYDVIVSEPSNPWMAGVAALFTREFFAAARARLKPGGVLCQWAHTYEMGEGDLKSIAATFASVFPQGTMWMVGDGDLLLIGSTDTNIESRLAEVPRRLGIGAVPAALEDVAIVPDTATFVIMSLFAGGPSALTAYSRGASLQTDDRMALEFTAAQSMYARAPNENAAQIRSLLSRTSAPPIVQSTIDQGDARSWSARGRTALKADALAMARESFRRAVTLDTHAVDALRGVSQASTDERHVSEEVAWLRSLAAADATNAAVLVELSHVLASTGEVKEALAAANEASRLEPQSPLPLEQLASIFADEGDAGSLTPLAETLLARFPERAGSHYFHAASLFLQGRAPEAEVEARRVLAIDPQHAGGQNLLGAACATSGHLDCARAALEKAVQLSPRDAAPYTNLGFFYLQIGNPPTAAAYFGEALALEPDSENARKGLLQARGL
jgi:spermidine synthase